MTVRNLILKTHLWLGLTAAIFLFILGLTGSVIAFENDIEHWMNPALFYVNAGPHAMPEDDLIRTVEQRFAPARVAGVHIFRENNLAQAMQMTDRATVTINPYDGAILGRTTGASSTQKMIGYIHQLHTHLVPDPRIAANAARIGEKVVQVAGFLLCLLVPTGLILWWRMKRASIKWSASWFRICFDGHNTIGIYAGLFLFVAAVTGVLIGWEDVFYSATNSAAPSRFPPLQSAPADGAAPIGAGRAAELARAAMPGASLSGYQLPLNPKAAYAVFLRVPEDSSEATHSYVFVDQYNGKVLYVRNFLTDSPGYRAVRFNRSIHTGDVWGAPGHILMSISSLLLAAMVATGLVIWLKKLAV
jgi:uncharacterized iron-regulated membrane protein